jgi:hypothetical protein
MISRYFSWGSRRASCSNAGRGSVAGWGRDVADESRTDLAALYVQNMRLSPRQLSKLFVSRIHRIAAKVADPKLRDELYELADDVEERIEQIELETL